jgi:hypothetical protein
MAEIPFEHNRFLARMGVHAIDIPNCLRDIFSAGRNDLSKNAKGFTITWQDVCNLWISQRGICELCGRPFDRDPVLTARVKRPLQPSFDRLDNDKGYHAGNVRLL